jgi:hypothetical protein
LAECGGSAWPIKVIGVQSMAEVRPKADMRLAPSDALGAVTSMSAYVYERRDRGGHARLHQSQVCGPNATSEARSGQLPLVVVKRTCMAFEQRSRRANF